MAVTTTFGVLSSSVLDGLPFAEGTVTPTSRGLNTNLITSYITQASGQMAAALVSIGCDPEALTDDELQVVASGVLAYARAQCLIKREFPESAYRVHLDEWEARRTQVLHFTGGLGVSDPTNSQITSNSPATPNRRFKERWNGF